MIDLTLRFLVNEINRDLSPGGAGEFVILGNIARVESGNEAGDDGLQTQVVLTLVNIEEEKTLKNNPNFVLENQRARKFQPPLYLNLYLLFSCADSNYGSALTKISRLIGFFQRKYAFNEDNALEPFPIGLEQVHLDLHSLSMEQLNHLWGVLGSKYFPSALYRLRLTPVQTTVEAEVSVVTSVQVTGKILVEP